MNNAARYSINLFKLSTDDVEKYYGRTTTSIDTAEKIARKLAEKYGRRILIMRNGLAYVAMHSNGRRDYM